MTRSTSGPRDRYRRQVRDEVLALAWEQVASAGAAALSLKAIATRMGMTAPALYRYFAGRDELLTELVLGAYLDLAETVERADAPDRPADERLRAAAAALRGWAVAEPQRYLLLYGTPVPGYTAPPEATALASRIFAPVLAASGAAADPEDALARGLRFWTRLHGVLSLELAGHFAGMPVDPPRLYAGEVESLLA